MKVCPKCQKQFPDDANFCPVDAARLVGAEAEGGNDGLSTRFELGPLIGGSRTGAVHRATDKTTGAVCAVKLVAPAVVALPGLAQRLDRELRQLERVSSAGVVKVIGSGKRGETPWVAMELVDGAHTLAEAIAARGPIPAEQAAELVEVIGEALVEAAQVGVVHRDLAPKNVLYADGAVKLVNFSLPLPADKVPGVAEFVAPEQLEGRPVDQRSNLYSLGAIYYYVLTGQTPEGTGAVTPPSQLTGSIAAGAAIEGVILRALDRSPTKRFLTVRQFIDEVARAGRGEVIVLDKPVAAPRRARSELVSTLMGMSKKPAADAPVSPSAFAGGQAAFAPAAAAAPVAAAPVAAKHEIEPATSAATTLVDPIPAAAVAPPVVARPIVAAPIVAAPVLASPAIVAAAAAAKAEADDKDKKGTFRETMWFKKGDLDSKAAIEAAEERARSGKLVADKADTLPMDERYKDDGSISGTDKAKYSLRTGGTVMMKPVRDSGAGTGKVSEDELIGEMKGGRKIIFVAIGIGVAAIVAIALLLLT